MRRPPLAILAAALAFAAAGCGDDSLSAHDLRARASRICARTATATDRIPLPSTFDEGARFLRAGAAEMSPAVRRLRALRAPHDLRTSYAQAVALRAREIGLIAGQARAIDAGADPIDAYRALQAQLAPLTRMEDATWRALRVAACVAR